MKRATRTNAKHRKTLLMWSALEVAQKQGYQLMTLRAVAKHAKVSPTTVSKYFSTVAKLRSAVIKYALRHNIIPLVAQIYPLKPQLLNLRLRNSVYEYLRSL